jgi:hypothetical protein
MPFYSGGIQRARLSSNNKPLFRVLLNNPVDTWNPMVAMSYDDGYLTISVMRELDSSPTVYLGMDGDTEDITTFGTYAAPTAGKCRWKEIDGTYMPGLYEVQFEESLFNNSDASRYVQIYIMNSGITPTACVLTVELTTFNPQETLLDEPNGVETGLTVRNALRLISAALAGKLSGAATTTVAIKNAIADDKTRITATVDTIGNRSAITTDLTDS